MMIPRHAETLIRQKLANTPAIVLLGPRQVGKTTLARQIAASWPGGTVYLDLERPADRLRLDDADSYLRAQQGKLVILDEIHRAPGVFEVLRGIIDDHRQAGQRGGQFLLLGSAALDLMRQSSETLAGRVAYLDIAPLDIREAAGGNIDANTLNDLLGHPVCGLSFEGFCIENLVLAAGTRRVPHYYRTHAGAEIDLLLEKGGRPEMAIEVKRSSAPSPGKGFAQACDDLGITQRFVVYPGDERFALRHESEAIDCRSSLSCCGNRE